jgi:hypothetical protein
LAAQDVGVLSGFADRSHDGLAELRWTLVDQRPAQAERDEAEQESWALRLPADETTIARPTAQPYLRLLAARPEQPIPVEAGMLYGARRVPLAVSGNPVRAGNDWFWRDTAAERSACARLDELGLTLPAFLKRLAAEDAVSLGPGRTALELSLVVEEPLADVAAGQAEKLVEQLLQDDWVVEGEKGRYRRGTRAAFRLKGADGTWWLDGHGQFGEVGLSAFQLLAAIRQGRRFVRLGSGDVGVLPREWLERWSLVAAAAPEVPSSGGGIALTTTRAATIAALLEMDREPPVEAGTHPWIELSRGACGDGDRALPGPAFAGTLRPYQEHGLWWLRQMRRLGLGGALCDEMGLGKTVQVIAHLVDGICAQPEHPGAVTNAELAPSSSGSPAMRSPTLIVSPTSLVFNWAQEAARFAPHLRVVEHLGPRRTGLAVELQAADLVLTSYSILLRDLELLSSVHFGVAVLDEAQVIKNPRSRTARATRRLRATQRLVLTGTPIENHWADLWSLFEFLNPGMVTWSAFRRMLRAGEARGDGAITNPFARLVRPLRNCARITTPMFRYWV